MCGLVDIHSAESWKIETWLYLNGGYVTVKHLYNIDIQRTFFALSF